MLLKYSVTGKLVTKGPIISVVIISNKNNAGIIRNALEITYLIGLLLLIKLLQTSRPLIKKIFLQQVTLSKQNQTN